jgi:hypothetical protein
MLDGPGRPTLHKPEFAEQAYKLCLAGATTEDLADCFEVSRSAIDKWLQSRPEFAQAVRRGRALADGDVAEKLYSRAIGYTCKTIKILLYRGAPVEVPHTVHYPPDVRACTFWLRNRRPQQWQAQDKAVPDDDPNWREELEAAAERARHGMAE